VLGLLGPNGAGKTTTLRMVMGLITPSAGEIRVFGRLVRPGADILSRVGSFVEGSGFLPHLSGKANLRLYWQATGRPAADAHMAEALEIAGLGTAIERRVKTYSQGMRQRLAIAQAMLGLPDLLLLDEPTNGLDPPQIHAMREVLRGYAATGRTVLVSSHMLSEVEQTCSHVVVVHQGRTIAAGTVAEMVAESGDMVFSVDPEDRAIEVLRSLPGIGKVELDSDQGLDSAPGLADPPQPRRPGVVRADLRDTTGAVAVAALVNAGVAVTTAAPRNRLEDVFLELVGAAGQPGTGGGAK
jgi:ABC-2 type transport system ATP-binding protein